MITYLSHLHRHSWSVMYDVAINIDIQKLLSFESTLTGIAYCDMLLHIKGDD